MQIVALIRKSKDRRQLLFTTHNPNIVVNGDADKVIALKSGDTRDTANEGRVQIDVDGAIETPEIWKVITQIMEGGKKRSTSATASTISKQSRISVTIACG